MIVEQNIKQTIKLCPCGRCSYLNKPKFITTRSNWKTLHDDSM